jgi:hypothetical protein
MNSYNKQLGDTHNHLFFRLFLSQVLLPLPVRQCFKRTGEFRTVPTNIPLLEKDGLGAMTLAKLLLRELFVVLTKNSFWAATHLCLCYVPAKCAGNYTLWGIN